MHHAHIKLWIIGKTRCGVCKNFSECKSKTVLKNKGIKSIKRKKTKHSTHIKISSAITVPAYSVVLKSL